jgi:hypothetical protein
VTDVWLINCSRASEARVGLSPESPTYMSVVTPRKERVYPGQGGISGGQTAAHIDDRVFETEIAH